MMDLPKVGLAPMEGVLDPLLRQVITKHSLVDVCTTEFVRITDKLLPKHVFYRYSPELLNGSTTASGVPVLVQILGGKPEWMAKNAQHAIELGARGIDINFGCPAKTVNKHDGGASLLKNPTRLYDTISAIKNNLPAGTHVSAKVRLGYSDKTKILDIAKACSDAGASWLTVHARTKEEGYQPPAHWHLIAEMKSVSKIPIIANGDIWSLKDYKNCVLESGCESVMIGRGLLRNPMLAKEIKKDYEILSEEKFKKTLLMMLEYLELSPFVYGESVACGRIKQWLKICTYPQHKGFEYLFEKIKKINQVQKMRVFLQDTIELQERNNT